MSVDDELRRRLQQAADQAARESGLDFLNLVNHIGGPVSPSAMPVSSSARVLGGLGAAGLLVGGALGFTLLSPDDGGDGAAATIDAQQYTMYDCPDGVAAGTAYAGDRVFVIGRDESGGWYEIRDPRNQSSVVWIPTGAVDPDEVIDVPIHDCVEPTEGIVAGAATTTSTLVVETSTTIGQGAATTTTTKKTTQSTTGQGTTPPTAPPTVPPDTTPPVVAQAFGSPNRIYDSSHGGGGGCPSISGLQVQASDNVGVTQVTGTYSGLSGSPMAFANGGGNLWTATFGPFSGLNFLFDQTITISIVARDAAGNTSGVTTASVRVSGDCVG